MGKPASAGLFANRRRTKQAWTPDDILELIKRKRAGEFASDIAAAMGRSEAGLKTRWRIIRAEMMAQGLRPPVGALGPGPRRCDVLAQRRAAG